MIAPRRIVCGESLLGVGIVGPVVRAEIIEAKKTVYCNLLIVMKITRRSVVSGVCATTLAAVAGCSSGIGGGLSVETVNARSTSFGNIVLTVSVSNSSGSSKSRTLIGQVDVSGGDTYTKRRTITVTADSSNTFELTFDIALSESVSASQYDYSVELE